MGQVIPKVKGREESPAPCDYQVVIKPSTPSYSMAARRKDSKS